MGDSRTPSEIEMDIEIDRLRAEVERLKGVVCEACESPRGSGGADCSGCQFGIVEKRPNSKHYPYLVIDESEG